MNEREIPVLPEIYDPKSADQITRIARATAILDRLSQLLDFSDTMLAHEIETVDAQALEAKYPDARDYFMFHLAIASTPDTTPKYFDFPGDDSICQMLEALAGKEGFDISTKTVEV